MRQTVIDGVPVFWEQGPAPMMATLTFGCGARDETFRTLGVTHLLEHLALSTMPRVHHEYNATVGMEVTQFYAVGRPEQLVEFLATVCRTLAALPLDRIEKEAGVLAAECSTVIHRTPGVLLAGRYGAAGLGLAPWGGPGYDRIPAETVTAHAARFFTTGNAVLTLTGPPPDGLRLPLPEGTRPVHRISPPLPVAGPRWSAEAVPGPGLCLTGPAASAPWSLGMNILRERLIAVARREKGFSYDVACEWWTPDPSTRDYAVWVDAREGQEGEVATILWDTVRELANLGPERRELEHEVAAFAEVAQDPRIVDAELDGRARAELLGEPFRTKEEWLADLAAVTPDQVAAALSAGLRSARLVVPDGFRLELSDLDGRRIELGGCWRPGPAPEGREFRPPLRARMTNAGARRARLVLTADAVANIDDDGDVHLIRFADVVGMELHGDARMVFGRDGCVVLADPELFRAIGPVVAALDAAVDPAVCYERTELANLG